MRKSHLPSGLYLLFFVFTATLTRAATVATSPATVITTNSATLNGVANPGGTSYSGYFQYGITTSYGNTTAQQSLGNGVNNVNFSQLITGLNPGQTYHCRAAITTVFFSTIYGNDQTFITTSGPFADTEAASPVHPGQSHPQRLCHIFPTPTLRPIGLSMGPRPITAALPLPTCSPLEQLPWRSAIS